MTLTPRTYLLVPFLLVACSCIGPKSVQLQTIHTLSQLAAGLPESAGRVVPSDPLAGEISGVQLIREWQGDLCRFHLVNAGTASVRLKEVLLFTIRHGLPGSTKVYGEGFTMLSQTGGTLDTLADIGSYTDRAHYRIPEPPGMRAVYGLLTLTSAEQDNLLLGFTSCRRFVGKFYVSRDSIQVVIDCENLTLHPGERWQLEEFQLLKGPDRNRLLEAFAARINVNHPRLAFREIPTGWCSWYCFGPDVTAKNVRDNLGFIRKNIPQLRYIQIDDGYQPHMGDWLEPGTSFGGDIQAVLKEIRTAGFEPALWIAPFIADSSSKLFREHPEWFVKDDRGKPLRSDKVTFGGWRMGPWYVLDGTHPGVQDHLQEVFRTLRTAWGCTYFKMDANFWGAIHGGHFFDSTATRVEAYRRGMEAIRRGAGDAYLLGCNHPLWPSLGTLHGARASLDIGRSWTSIRGTGKENLYRNWQNGRLWWNDPDAAVLSGDLPLSDIMVHASVIRAAGGMVLSGDDLTAIPPGRLNMLKKLLPPSGNSARFSDETLTVGRIEAEDMTTMVLFNWDDAPAARSFPLLLKSRIRDYWTEEDLGVSEHAFTIKDMPPRSARILILTPAR
jgi:alpha-galactosidase